MIWEDTPPYTPPTVLRRLAGSRWTLDTVAVAMIAATGALLGYMVVTNAQVLFFYQNLTPEIIYASCGFGYKHPGELTGPIIDFVMMRTQSLDCSNLQGVESLHPPTLFAILQMYLGWTIASFWQGPILTYAELWPLAALAYVIYAVGTFVLLRLFFPLLLALPGAALLTLSPIALSILVSFRDFSKAPFTIWAIVFFVLIGRAKTLWSGTSWAILGGVTVGIGAGFRVDLLVLAGLIGISLLAVWGAKAFLRRAICVIVFAATVAVAAKPAFDIPDTGGNGTVISQGLSEPFRRFLGLEGGTYILGHAYLDELAMASVAAVERQRTPDWDANEPNGYNDVSQVMKVSLPHVLEWLPYFAADLATQGLKSASWIVALPSLTAPKREAWDPGGPIRFRQDPSQWLALFHDFIGQPWLVLVTVLGLLLFAWREAALRPGTSLSVALLFAGLLAMPVAQFSVRHVFHLEFFWVMALLSFVAAWRDRAKLVAVTPWFARSVSALVVTVGVVYVGLVAYQTYALPREFAKILSMPRERAATLQRVRTDENNILGSFTVPVPENRRDIVEAEPDALTDKLPIRGLAWDVRAEADRLLLSLDGCGEGQFKVDAIYETRPGIWQILDYSVQIPAGETGDVQVLLPAFYRPTQNLAKVTVFPLGEACAPRLERIVGHTPLPPHLIAWFPTDWRESWKRRGFGNFGKAPE